MIAAAALKSDALERGDVLVFPMSKRAVVQRGFDASGAPELTLFYGDKEITFDNPDHFGFGETLARQSVFPAGAAIDWCDAGWPRVSEMLANLIDAGVLRHADADTTDATFKLGHEDRPSPLAPAPAHQPNCWAEDGAALMQRLTGAPLDMGYLETVVPIFRVAHMFVDTDGRQVGEANVFPPALRFDVATQWRTCTYPGTRYQPDKPMNVTALKAMRIHWRQMMALLLQMRVAYLDRFPKARDAWTVGDLERLSTCVLALPSYMVLRHDDPVANGNLHPALSNLFRVTDGLRMTMHQMLFVPFHERMRTPDETVTAAEVFAYAERNYSFHSPGAVCAGPQFMIEEFLSVIIDGTEPKSGMPKALDPEVEAAAALIDRALDYGLLGLEAFGTIFSTWPAMTRCYHEIHAVLADWPEPAAPTVAAIRDRFERHFLKLTTDSYLANEEWRGHREAVYDEMYGQCVFGVTGAWPAQTLIEILEPLVGIATDAPGQALRTALSALLGEANTQAETHLDILATSIMDFLTRAQRIVALGEAIQADTNRLLCRLRPERSLTLADLALHTKLMGDDVRTLPFLPDELAELFGISIHVDAHTIEIRDLAASSRAASASHSVGASLPG
jgi:hypothetical protein